MSKNLSAKYCQENKERLQKTAREIYQNLFKEEKEKSINMVVNITKTSKKMENKSLLSKEWEKALYYSYRKVFKFRKFCFFIMKSIRKICAYIWKILSKQTKRVKFFIFRLWFFKLGARKFHLQKYKKTFF